MTKKSYFRIYNIGMAMVIGTCIKKKSNQNFIFITYHIRIECYFQVPEVVLRTVRIAITCKNCPEYYVNEYEEYEQLEPDVRVKVFVTAFLNFFSYETAYF